MEKYLEDKFITSKEETIFDSSENEYIRELSSNFTDTVKIDDFKEDFGAFIEKGPSDNMDPLKMDTQKFLDFLTNIKRVKSDSEVQEISKLALNLIQKHNLPLKLDPKHLLGPSKTKNFDEEYIENLYGPLLKALILKFENNFPKNSPILALFLIQGDFFSEIIQILIQNLSEKNGTLFILEHFFQTNGILNFLVQNFFERSLNFEKIVQILVSVPNRVANIFQKRTPKFFSTENFSNFLIYNFVRAILILENVENKNQKNGIIDQISVNYVEKILKNTFFDEKKCSDLEHDLEKCSQKCSKAEHMFQKCSQKCSDEKIAISDMVDQNSQNLCLLDPKESENMDSKESTISQNVDPNGSKSSHNLDPKESKSSQDVNPNCSKSSQNLDPKESKSSQNVDPVNTISIENLDSKKSKTSPIEIPVDPKSSQNLDSKKSKSSQNSDSTELKSNQYLDSKDSKTSPILDPLDTKSSQNLNSKNPTFLEDAIKILSYFFGKIVLNFSDFLDQKLLVQIFECLVEKNEIYEKILTKLLYYLENNFVEKVAVVFLKNCQPKKIQKVFGDLLEPKRTWFYILTSKLSFLTYFESDILIFNLVTYISKYPKMANEFLISVLKTWSSKSAIIHTALNQHAYVTKILIQISKILDTKGSIFSKNEVSQLLIKGVPFHLESPNAKIRIIGMVTSEFLFNSILKSDDIKLNFDYSGFKIDDQKWATELKNWALTDFDSKNDSQNPHFNYICQNLYSKVGVSRENFDFVSCSNLEHVFRKCSIKEHECSRTKNISFHGSEGVSTSEHNFCSCSTREHVFRKCSSTEHECFGTKNDSQGLPLSSCSMERFSCECSNGEHVFRKCSNMEHECSNIKNCCSETKNDSVCHALSSSTSEHFSCRCSTQEHVFQECSNAENDSSNRPYSEDDYTKLTGVRNTSEHDFSKGSTGLGRNKNPNLVIIDSENFELDSDDDLEPYEISDDPKFSKKDAPSYLRDLRDQLIDASDPEVFQLCLEHAENLILTQLPNDDSTLAVELLEIFMSLEKKYFVENFDQLVFHASVYITSIFPVECSKFLSQNFHAEIGTFSISQRIFMLDVLSQTSVLLSKFDRKTGEEKCSTSQNQSRKKCSRAIEARKKTKFTQKSSKLIWLEPENMEKHEQNFGEHDFDAKTHVLGNENASGLNQNDQNITEHVQNIGTHVQNTNNQVLGTKNHVLGHKNNVLTSNSHVPASEHDLAIESIKNRLEKNTRRFYSQKKFNFKPNEFSKVAGNYFFPLVYGFTNFSKFALTPRYDTDHILLIHFLKTLSKIVYASQNCPIVPKMAREIFEISYTIRYHNESKVRLATLHLMAAAIVTTPSFILKTEFLTEILEIRAFLITILGVNSLQKSEISLECNFIARNLLFLVENLLKVDQNEFFY